MKELLNKVEAAIEQLNVDAVPVEEIKGLLTETAAHLRSEEEREVAARFEQVRRAVNTLSYSEEEALAAIIDEVEESGGLLVASKVADRMGITRSVIVNAMRKLESGGVLRTKSLGMKGTRFTPLIPGWKSLVAKARQMRRIA